MATKPISTPAPTIAVVAMVPVQYDGTLVPPGEPLDVREADLAQLLEVAAVTLA